MITVEQLQSEIAKRTYGPCRPSVIILPLNDYLDLRRLTEPDFYKTPINQKVEFRGIPVFCSEHGTKMVFGFLNPFDALI
jgi:hypothetical protein